MSLASPTGGTAVSTGAIGVRLHGVTLTLRSSHAPLIAYAAQHLGPLAGPPLDAPDLEVEARWTDGPAPAEPFGSDDGLTTIGKRMKGDASQLRWCDTLRMDGLRLRFARTGAQWHFDVDYHYRPKRRDGEPIPGYEAKRYFSLMSYLVYYPLLWYLGRMRNWIPVHASSLDTPLGGVLLAGLGGVGKTTSCVAMLGQPGVSLLSENLTLTDGDAVYGCHEPIRLDPGSVALLDGGLAAFVEIPFDEGLKKKQLFHPRSAPVERTTPRVILLPEFSSARGLVPVAADFAAEKMAAMNRLTCELDDLGWYSAALDLHWPEPGRAGAEALVLRSLTHRVRCFTLKIDRSAGVNAVVEDIFAALAMSKV